MHKSRAIRAFERRLFELGCPASYSQRSIAELAEHFEDLTDARIENGLEPATARSRASEELGEPTVLAERLVASFRQASWWGRHPIIGFCLLPPLLLMLFLPATVLALYGLFLLGNLFSRHAIPLDEFKSAVETAPAAFAEWNNPLLCFIHSVPIAVNTILFCKLVGRSAAGMKWLIVTCAVCAATGFFTWTGFSPSGFYLGYGSPSVYNWLSAAVPVLIAAAIMVWRRRRLSLIGLSDSQPEEPLPQPAFALHESSNKHAAPMELERWSRDVDSYRHGAPTELNTPVHGPKACAERNEPLQEQPGKKSLPKVRRSRILIREEWFTPTSAVAAAIVVIAFLLVKFVFTHDKADYAKLEDLRNRIWPMERKQVLDLLQIRQSIRETSAATPVSLQAFVTAPLSEPVCWFGKTNFATLADLPRGLHTFAGIPFTITERVQLMGKGYKDLGMAFPSAATGIPIRQKCSSLYLLHGASFVRTKAPFVPDEQGFTPLLPQYETTNSPVARLVLHYADQTRAEIEIFSTEHLLDVWGPICTSEVPIRERCVSSPDTELAWTSSRVPKEKSELLNSVRLYKSRFENPKPDAEILSLDYVSTRTEAAPFLLGLTIE